MEEIVKLLVSQPKLSDQLLERIDTIAREDKCYEYGLPLYSEPMKAQLREVVLQWVSGLEPKTKCHDTWSVWMENIVMETKEQFMERYQKETKRPNIFDDRMIAMPCDCEVGGGATHWAAVHRDPMMVETHLELYAPKGTPWPDEVPELTTDE